jgi:hypothetical protein
MKIRIIILSVVLALLTTTAIFAQDCSLNGAAPTDNCPIGTIGDDLFIVTGSVNSTIWTDAGADLVDMTGGGTITMTGAGHAIYDMSGSLTVVGGSITITDNGWSGIVSGGDGSVVSSANINSDVFGADGIVESGAGNLVNNGNITLDGGGGHALQEFGTGDVINTGIISVTQPTGMVYTTQVIVERDEGSVINNGDIIASGTYPAIEEYGSGDVINNGNIIITSKNMSGISENDAGNVINNGSITVIGGGGGIEQSNGFVINNGTILATGSGIGIDTKGEGDAINNGTITMLGEWATGIRATGGGNVINNGVVNVPQGDGIKSGNGSHLIVNNGTITAGDNAIWGNQGDDTFINNGIINGRVFLGLDDDTVTNNGIVNGTVSLSSGNDTVTNNGTVNGAINLGAGNDTMTVRGVVTGTMDGGADWDTLIFDMTVEGTSSDLNALAREMAAANPAGGSITINGYTFTWVNFESLINLLRFIESNPNPRPCAFDGRINAFDCQAPVTLYYHPLQIWGVDPNTGAGTFAFSITQEQIDAAGIPTSGTVLIASGTHPVTGLPISLYRHANGAFQINAFFPDMKPYVGIWMEYGGFTNISGEQS